MSNLDILEVALFNIKDKLDSFHHLVANIDNQLVNAENYLLDNGDALNPIFENFDEQSIFTSYSQASRETRKAPIKLEDIHLRATKPTLNTPNEHIQTCNVLMTPITFSNFNQYFTSKLGDTLHFYVTDLETPRPSLQLGCNFITTGLDLIRGCNFKITNDFFTIQPDLRDQTIDINIRALDTSNIAKYEIYDSFNYLSDPYTIRIVELPAIRFTGVANTELSKTISIYAPNNTQIQCNLLDILEINTNEGVYIIEKLTGVSADNEAYYLLGNNSNAVYIGDFVENILTIHADPIIYINPEYRGNTYSVSFNIYASNFTERKLRVNLDITEDVIDSIELSTGFETEFSNLSNNVIVIDNLADKYNYVYSNELVFTIVNDSIPTSVSLNEDEGILTITPNLRNYSCNIIIKAEEQYITQNENVVLSNSELIFKIHELPPIRLKDSYIGSNYYRFDTSQYKGVSYDFTETDLTKHMFVKGLEECNIILDVKDSSTFKAYQLNDSSNELTIHFDNDYYELCNIDFEAYLENYPDSRLETTIRVILEQPVLKESSLYYYLIDDKYLNPITHKIEFPNIFKNTQDDADQAISITSIEGESANSFNYDQNMIYSYIKPTYRQYNTIVPNITLSDSIEFSNFNNDCNEIGPYYQIDEDKYNVIYAFKHNADEYTIKFEEKYHNCNLEVLIVGGGGGGSSGTTIIEGIGGSGGNVIYSNITIDSNITYSIVVGDGGDGGDSGSNSSFDSIVAIGGNIGAIGGSDATNKKDIFYVNNSWIESRLDFKVEGVGYSNVEERIFSNLGCNLSSFMLSIGAGSTTENPLIGKYEENSSNFYDIYKNIYIGDHNDSKIYLGGGGQSGYSGGTKTNIVSRSTYSCGYYQYGQLGRTIPTGTSDNKIPMQITETIGDSNIVAISAGDLHSLFLDENGNVYSCGYNNYGQLGTTVRDRDNHDIQIQITETISDSNIVAISTGEWHSVFLDENGNVYSCGYNNKGQLGRIGASNIPMQITETIGDSNIVAISAGGYHSLFLDETGNVYSCGRNGYGQLGLGTISLSSIPKQITATIATSNIVAISGGRDHSLFLDETGNVYSCGRNNYGQLGLGTISFSSIPVQITETIGDSNIVAISTGNYHSLFLAENGNVYSCGLGTYGQLGRLDGAGNIPILSADRAIPMQITETIDNSNIVAISAGGNHSLFLDKNGNVYSCGRDIFGQLGRTGDNKIPMQITETIGDSIIVAISAGGVHSLFISIDTEPPILLGGGGDAVEDNSSPGKSLSGGGGSGGAIGINPGGKGGSGIVLLKYNTGYYYYPDEYYCNLAPPFYQELTVTASNIFGENTGVLRFVRLGYTTLTVPNLTSNKVSNIYLSQDEVTCNVGRTFSIEYNPLYENLDTVDCNLIITDTNNSNIYDIIINLGDNINNIFRITESEDDTGISTYSL